MTTTHKITEEDILSGSFENTATATGTDPNDGEVSASDDETVKTVAQAPALTVEKKADKTSGADLNDVITYTITVTNSGNVTVSDIKVNDAKTELEESIGTLAPGKDASVTTKHKITEADILAGSFVNTATATGTDPNGGEVSGSDDETVTTVAQAPALTVVVSASKNSGEELGETVTYTIKVTNSGNVTVSDITVTDPLTGLNQNIDTLAPGESASVMTTHKTTEEDILAHQIENTATATGTAPSGGEATGRGSATVRTVDAAPELTVEKTADKTSGAALGEEITYTITVTNSGNETVNHITVVDPLSGLKKVVGTLAPGKDASVTTTHTITEADILAGKIVNTATATGTDPNGKPVTGSDDATVITAAPAPAWTVTKTVSGATGADGRAVVDDALTYTITIKNTGNVTLMNLKVTDMFIGNHGTQSAMTVASDREGAEPVLAGGGTLPSLAVGETVTIRYTYRVDPKDVTLENTVSVQSGEGESKTANTETNVVENPDFAVEKKLAKVGGTDYIPGNNVKVGDELTYAITVANKGNTVLNGLAVSDALNDAPVDLSSATLGKPEGSGAAFDGKTLSGVGIGETVTITYTYTVKATDTTLTNAAIVGDKPDDTKQTETTVEEMPAYSANKALRLVNGAAYHSGTKVAVGDELTYAITAANEGNTVLNGLAVSDKMNGTAIDLSKATLDKPEGSSATFGGKTLSGVGIGISSTIASAPANGTGYEPGETIAYDVVVTNSGNLELHDVEVTDSLTGMNEAIESFSPGASVTLHASHVVTEADLLGANGYASSVTELELDDEGGIKMQLVSEPSKVLANTATVAGVASNNAAVAATSSAEAPNADVKADVSVEETARLDGARIRTAEVPVGAVIEYEITVTNKGNVTTRQTIKDGFVLNDDAGTEKELTLTSEGVPYDKSKAFTLSPEQSKVFTARYTVQATDKTLFNRANVAGQESSVAMTVADTPALAVEKAADATGPVGLNDEITYTITATNAGNVPLTDVTVSDPLTGLDQNVGELAPGASATVTTTHVVAAADVAAGSVVNTATATGNDHEGEPVEQDSNTVTVTALPRVTLTVNYWYGAVGGAVAAPTFNATYFAGAAYRVASPVVVGYNPSRATVAGTITRDAKLDVIYTAIPYTLTIHYVYEDGTAAAEAYTDTLAIGDSYSVTSPVIEGYTASDAVVAGKMPGRNVTITVIYLSEATNLPIDMHGISLDIGDVTMNVGECFE